MDWSTASVARDNWRPHLKRREQLKHSKYDEACAREGWAFRAMAFGTWGGTGPEGAKVLARLTKQAGAHEKHDRRGALHATLLQTVGVALFTQLFQLMEARFCTIPLDPPAAPVDSDSDDVLDITSDLPDDASVDGVADALPQ